MYVDEKPVALVQNRVALVQQTLGTSWETLSSTGQSRQEASIM